MMTQDKETLREAVAFAIFAAGFHPDDLLSGVVLQKWNDWPDERRKAMNKADAAIATMFERLRTPSEGVIQAGGRSEGVILDDFDGVEIFPKRIWQAMLDKFQQENGDER